MTADAVRVVQFPHPGPEHVPGADGRRPWPPGNAAHRRTFLASVGRYRDKAHPRTTYEGDVQFWGEWEGAAVVARELDNAAPGPRFLCRPDPSGPPPRRGDGVPPQNTDPYVWGDTFRYSICRQPNNRKLRELAPGSLILFGSGIGGEFVLDTVFVVARWQPHTFETYRGLDTSPDHKHWSLYPAHGWGAGKGRTFRMYEGATPDDEISGMFSFVPCLPTHEDGFERPPIRLPGYVDPGNWRQAKCSEPVKPAAAARIWREVVRQVTDYGLMLATRLELADPGQPYNPTGRPVYDEADLMMDEFAALDAQNPSTGFEHIEE